MRRTLLLYLLLGAMAPAEPLHKIEVLSTNTEAYFLQEAVQPFARFETEDLRRLRAHAEDFGLVVDEAGSDQELVRACLSWVCEQWRHHGFNESTEGSTALDVLRLVHEKNQHLFPPLSPDSR